MPNYKCNAYFIGNNYKKVYNTNDVISSYDYSCLSSADRNHFSEVYENDSNDNTSLFNTSSFDLGVSSILTDDSPSVNNNSFSGFGGGDGGGGGASGDW